MSLTVASARTSMCAVGGITRTWPGTGGFASWANRTGGAVRRARIVARTPGASGEVCCSAITAAGKLGGSGVRTWLGASRPRWS
jgi:hypothetical protein